MSWVEHSEIVDHNAAWDAACADLGIADILAVSREQFSEALQLAVRILYFEKSRRKEDE